MKIGEEYPIAAFIHRFQFDWGCRHYANKKEKRKSLYKHCNIRSLIRFVDMIHIEKITGLLDFHISPSASVGSSMASSQSAPDPADA